MTVTEQHKRVCLGAIVGVHGIRGEVKVKSWTHADKDIGAYGTLENEDGTKSFMLRVTGHSKELLRCKIKGVDDRNTAESLIGERLYVERSMLPPLSGDEYYQADLIGLEVRLLSDVTKTVGTVSGIYNFGAGDILELKLPHGENEMIPFNKEYVPQVCIDDGYLVVSAAGLNFMADDEADDEG